MTGRQLAYAALWANGASVTLCAQIMNVNERTVRSVWQGLRDAYAAEGITIRNSAGMAQALAVAFPVIRPPGRPSPITPELLAEAQRLRVDDRMSFERIAAELGVKRNALTRAMRRVAAATGADAPRPE